MNLSTVLTSRRAETGGRDPDTLHGLLYLAEAGAKLGDMARLVGNRSLGKLLDKARCGDAGRVEAFKGTDHRAEFIDFPDGILPVRWKRDIIMGLLRADGLTTSDIEDMLVHIAFESGTAISRLRQDLKVFGVGFEVWQGPGNSYRYRMMGRNAWRMQRIIANGWSL